MSLFKDKLRVNYKGGSRFRENDNDNSLGVERRFRLKAGIGVLSIAAIYTLKRPFLGTHSDPDESQDLPYY
jgi:hypothetical protein